MTHDMKSCIEQCNECHTVCVETMQHCISKGGKHADAHHLAEMTDCAQLCAIAADFMMRNSDLHERTCGVCAEACAHCAQSCETMNDDDAMQHCIDICRRCEESCREMAGESVKH